MRRGAAARELHRDKGLRFVADGYELVPTKQWDDKFRAKDQSLPKVPICGSKAATTSGGLVRSTPSMSSRPTRTSCAFSTTLGLYNSSFALTPTRPAPPRPVVLGAFNASSHTVYAVVSSAMSTALMMFTHHLEYSLLVSFYANFPSLPVWFRYPYYPCSGTRCPSRFISSFIDSSAPLLDHLGAPQFYASTTSFVWLALKPSLGLQLCLIA